MSLPKKPIFSDNFPSSWTEADKADNKTLVTKYEAFQLFLKLTLKS